MKKLTAKEAIKYLVNEGLTMYSIAKRLQVQPIMVSRYRHGISKMSKQTAEKALAEFNIEITDISTRGVKSKWTD